MANHLIFDTKRKELHMRRASEDFLLREMLTRLTDRLKDINRTFAHVLDIGSHGLLADYLGNEAQITRANDAEMLPYEPDRFDAVIGCGTLHWVNDLPGMLIQIQRVLKPDGLFLGMLPGNETLHELRSSFEAAEMEMKGGISPRVSPFVEIRDAGALLQRAGFALPVADSERLEIEYEHPLKLLHDLQKMGQSNALIESKKTFTPCSLMMRMCDIYLDRYRNDADRIVASFDLITLTGWKPHDSQQKPAKRGSGKMTLLSSPPTSGDPEPTH